MKKIPIDKLREMWENEGIHGKWRKILKKGFSSGELYFEFGVMPEKHHEYGEYRIVLDHEVIVRMCPKDVKLLGEYVIRSKNTKNGKIELLEKKVVDGVCCHTFYVTDEEYEKMIRDAKLIYEEYKDEYIVCFWSIPNKWFSNLSLIRFISDHIVLSEDYKKRTHSRHSLYWP